MRSRLPALCCALLAAAESSAAYVNHQKDCAGYQGSSCEECTDGRVTPCPGHCAGGGCASSCDSDCAPKEVAEARRRAHPNSNCAECIPWSCDFSCDLSCSGGTCDEGCDSSCDECFEDGPMGCTDTCDCSATGFPTYPGTPPPTWPRYPTRSPTPPTAFPTNPPSPSPTAFPTWTCNCYVVQSTCDESCDDSCDHNCWLSCNQGCDHECDESCDCVGDCSTDCVCPPPPPTGFPSRAPQTSFPTWGPPTNFPTYTPSTSFPSGAPRTPTNFPTEAPSTGFPTASAFPTEPQPTGSPTGASPTSSPTGAPQTTSQTGAPQTTILTGAPALLTQAPSFLTEVPSTAAPTAVPPTSSPTATGYPSSAYPTSPTGWPSTGYPVPAGYPSTGFPSTGYPSRQPTGFPTPTGYPSRFPSGYPSGPSGYPSGLPSRHPTGFPTRTGFPSRQPTGFPSRGTLSPGPGPVLFSSCTARPGQYTVDGVQRDSPCHLSGSDRHVDYVDAHGDSARLYTCSAGGSHHFVLCTCSGVTCAANEEPRTCFVAQNNGLGCGGTLRGAVFSNNGTEAFIACNKEVRVCRVDLGSRNGNWYRDCQVLQNAGCPRWAGIRGIAARPRGPTRGDLLVVVCTDRKTRACSLDSGNMQMQPGRQCVNGRKRVCEGIGKPSGLSFNADKKLLVPCDDGYSYSKFVGGIVQDVTHSVYSGDRPCPTETNAVADLGSGRAAVACGPDGVRECQIQYS